MIRKLIPVFMVALCTVLLADDAPKTDSQKADPPQSAAAVQAQTTYDNAVKRAKEAYQQAMVAADNRLMTDLQAAMKIASTTANADEIVRIAGALKTAKSLGTNTEPKPEQRLRINSALWGPTGTASNDWLDVTTVLRNNTTGNNVVISGKDLTSKFAYGKNKTLKVIVVANGTFVIEFQESTGYAGLPPLQITTEDGQ